LVLLVVGHRCMYRIREHDHTRMPR
jgi:hypothetical protein